MGMANSEWSWTVSADGHHSGEWTRANLAGCSVAALIDLVLEMQAGKCAAEAYAKEALRALAHAQVAKMSVDLELEDVMRELSRWRVGR